MARTSRMSRAERDLLESIGDHIQSMTGFSHALANRAEPDFSLQAKLSAEQAKVSAEDLVLPLKVGRFPDEQVFAGSSQLFEVYALFSFVVSQYVFVFDEDDPLSGLYVSAVSLVGIVRHQSPESAEFGIAERCLVLLKASRAVTSVSKEVVASFVDELRQDVTRNSDKYWDPDWVMVSLLATALALTSRPSVRSDLEKELHGSLCSTGWQAVLAQKKGDIDEVDEAQAMENLLEAVAKPPE